jgi:hypothetical protein
MRPIIRTAVGVAVGCVIGLGTVLAIGAADGPGRSYPRYVVESSGASLLVTDNASGKLFVYQNAIDGKGDVVHRLHHILDLSNVGRRELTSEKAE